MAKHKSVEAARLTALGTAVHNWSNVLFNGVSVADVSDMQTMREVAQMEDTPENREMLQAAVYRCGLSDSDAESLASWVAGDDPLWNMMPEGCGYPMFSMRRDMQDELAACEEGK